MEWFVVFAVVAVVAIAIVLRFLKSSHSVRDDAPGYTRNDPLFTAAEISFLGALEQAVGNEYRVFGKVRVVDVVSVGNTKDRSARQSAFNRISSKHFDFLVCTQDDISIKAAIELNDKSHESRKGRERDRLLTEVCESASLPLLFVRAQHSYSVAELREKVLGLLDGEAAPTAAEPMPQEQDTPACPKCSSPMVRRVSKKGANAGAEFWGCSEYPRCRGVIASTQQRHDVVVALPADQS